MIGGIIGDICGSYYEYTPVTNYDFELKRNISSFTDDTVLTIATANALLTGTSYKSNYKDFGKKHINRGFGNNFIEWLDYGSEPYNSYGNGSAMRVSPIGYIYDNIEETLNEARISAECTHNHKEGIKGGQAIALSIHLANIGMSKEVIKNEISKRFEYDLNRKLSEIKPSYKLDISCQGTVPEAIISFLESTNYESAIRNSIYLGGDADTLACMSGSIAEAYYKEIPQEYFFKALAILPEDFIEVITTFYSKYELKTKFILD